MIGSNTTFAFGFALAASLMAGCAAPVETSDAVASDSQSIVDGEPATAYTEAALIDFGMSICSGAIIAPRVALTAGHCIVGTSFTVTAPYANQSAQGSTTWTDYVPQAGTVNPNTIDVGVIILDTPIMLAKYPALARNRRPDGTNAINVGRIRNGQASSTSLFFGREITLTDATSFGYPFSYLSAQVIQPGDSGGPVYAGKGDDRKIIAVNSGAGGVQQVVARLDLAIDKIEEIIVQNGAGTANITD